MLWSLRGLSTLSSQLAPSPQRSRLIKAQLFLMSKEWYDLLIMNFKHGITYRNLSLIVFFFWAYNRDLKTSTRLLGTWLLVFRRLMVTTIPRWDLYLCLCSTILFIYELRNLNFLMCVWFRAWTGCLSSMLVQDSGCCGARLSPSLTPRLQQRSMQVFKTLLLAFSQWKYF